MSWDWGGAAVSTTGKPIFDYPPEFRAPEGEGCTTCGIELLEDAIDSWCSPECAEWDDRCPGCERGPTWCECQVTDCIDCGNTLSDQSQLQGFRTCAGCAKIRQQVRFDLGPTLRKVT